MSTNKRRFKHDHRLWPNGKSTPYPAWWQPWLDLVEVAPPLADLHDCFTPRQQPPPYGMGDRAFLTFVATLSNKRKREIMRALLFDLLRDDVVEMMVEVLQRKESQWRAGQPY